MFSDLALAVKEVGSLDLAAAGDDELSQAVVELARLRHALEAAEARLSVAWDSRRAWAADGARSGSAWAARRTRDPKAECGSRIWLGRAVAEMDHVASAWAAGDIGSAHVRRLARSRTRPAARCC